MDTQAVEFPTDRLQVSFVQTLLIASASQRALPFIEHDDPIMDNYQNYMEKFSWPVQESDERDYSNIQDS